MLQNGYWYDITEQTWQAARFPPYPQEPNVPEPEALFNFRGRPTIFGNPSCDSQGECVYLDVIQYNPGTNSWDNLGEMLHSRELHTVVEVPESFCLLAEFPEPRY